MSTPNFMSEAGTVYALRCGDDEEEVELAIDDAEKSVLAELEANNKVVVSLEDEPDGQRSYPGTSFASLEKTFHNEILYAEAKLIIRNGYYADANLDFSIKVYSIYSGEYYDLDEIDEQLVNEHLEFYRDKKPRKGAAASLLRRLNKEVFDLETIIRDEYEKVTTVLERVGTFSNGEAVYKAKTA